MHIHLNVLIISAWLFLCWFEIKYLMLHILKAFGVRILTAAILGGLGSQKLPNKLTKVKR